MASEKRPGFISHILKRAGWAAPFLVAIVLLLVGVGGPSAFEYSNTPEFCSSCHSMTDEFESWKASSHAETVTCIECHSAPGAIGELVAHIKGTRMLYLTLFDVKPAVAVEVHVPNDYCEKCHRSMESVQTSSVQVNHKKHLAENVSCQDCHAGLVHKANEEKSPDERFHNVCSSCHESKQVVLKAKGSTSCTACHSELTKVIPEDHTADWLAKHGKATANQNCGQCHLAESAGPHGTMSKPASFISTQPNDSCAACHQTTMPHPTSYLKQHGTDARSQGSALCANCHSPKTPATPKPSHAAADFCSNCHAGVPMPHAKDFISQHGTAAGTSGNQACLACHSSANQVRPSAQYASNDYCANCHAGLAMPHTQRFTASHGQQALQSGPSCTVCHSAQNPVSPKAAHASTSYCSACHDQSKHQPGWVAAHGPKANQVCYTCHSEDQGGKNSCQACHQGKPEQKNPFHPDSYWWIKHRTIAMKQGEQACAKCHAEIKPSCSKCHASR